MKIVTLLENTACKDGLCAAHGLSLYIETPRHKILFDMGPNDGFLTNAKALGVDLAAVDTAVLSHGHYDHGGGLAAFCEANSRAEVLIHMDAFGDFYATNEGREPRYIGLDPELWQIESRVLPTGGLLRLDDELTLFADEGDAWPSGLRPPGADGGGLPARRLRPRAEPADPRQGEGGADLHAHWGVGDHPTSGGAAGPDAGRGDRRVPLL